MAIIYQLKQLLTFTYLQALSCIFPVAIFLTLAVSEWIRIPFLYRYDLILIVCIFIQWVMLATGIETKDELKVIAVFHFIGLLLEVYKVQMGSWTYPEEGITKVLGVPLYSGFMYASVASYMCQSWRRLNIKLLNWPKGVYSIMIAVAIYGNFFTHHFFLDLRWALKFLLLIVFWKTSVSFRIRESLYRMPLIASFLLIGFFIWIAENIATFFGAWQYPNQQQTWEIVHIGKISSWFLLVIISFIIVAQLKHIKVLYMRKENELTTSPLNK